MNTYLFSINTLREKILFIVFSIVSLISYGLICITITNNSIYTSPILVSSIYLSDTFFIILYGIIFISLFSIISILQKQLFNTKITIEIFLFIFCLILGTTALYFFNNFWLSIFIFALNLLILLLFSHELKKTNKFCYAISFIILTCLIYILLNNYIICLMN